MLENENKEFLVNLAKISHFVLFFSKLLFSKTCLTVINCKPWRMNRMVEVKKEFQVKVVKMGQFFLFIWISKSKTTRT